MGGSGVSPPATTRSPPAPQDGSADSEQSGAQGGRQGLCTPGTLEQLKESKEKEEEEGQQPRIISAVTVCPRLCSGPWV